MGGAAPYLARFMEVKAVMTERSFNLVVPLAHEATDMRITDTGRQCAEWSGAVSRLSNRPSDVDSTTNAAGPGIRTSTTATLAHSSVGSRGGLARWISWRNQPMPSASIFAHCASVSRIERCTRRSSGGVGGRPRGRLVGSMPHCTALFVMQEIACVSAFVESQ